jgi:hypothetical protein
VDEEVGRNGPAVREPQRAHATVCGAIETGHVAFDARDARARSGSPQVRDIRRFIEMEAVGEARLQRRVVVHGSGKSRELRGGGGERILRGRRAATREQLADQVFVERRRAAIGADVAVRMQEARSIALETRVFGRELVGGPRRAQELPLFDADHRVHAA